MHCRDLYDGRMRFALALCLVGSIASADMLTISATTQPSPTATYAPANVVAVWAQDAGGAFVKTIQRWGVTPQMQTGLSSGGFTGVSIDFEPGAGSGSGSGSGSRSGSGSGSGTQPMEQMITGGCGVGGGGSIALTIVALAFVRRRR